MTRAGQAHVVNLTVLQPRKISADFNAVISAPCVPCHPGKGKNLKSTLWICSDHRVLGCPELLWAFGRGLGAGLVQILEEIQRCQSSVSILVQISCAGEPGHSTPGTGGSQTAALPVFYNNVFGKGDVRESCVTRSIKYLSSLLTGVQEQSSGTWRETSASLQHPHWNPTWSHQPGQARHTSLQTFPFVLGVWEGAGAAAAPRSCPL